MEPKDCFCKIAIAAKEVECLHVDASITVR